MPYKIVKLPLGSFSPIASEELEARLEIGIVNFQYIVTTDTGASPKGSLRTALGTRNLSVSAIPFGDVPWGGRIVPPHVLTYWDYNRKAWRCCVKSAITWISEEIIVEY